MIKKDRQKAILDVIAGNNIETQNQLIDELAKVGIESTQATLSRDIKALHLVKEMTINGNYRYTVSGKSDIHNFTMRLKAIFKEGVTSYAYAQNIVVIKTLPGLAPAACGAIDSMGIKGLVGSIAGDDTGFLAMTDTVAAERFCKELADLL